MLTAETVTVIVALPACAVGSNTATENHDVAHALLCIHILMFSVLVLLCLQVFGGTGGNVIGPEALVLWQLIGAGVSMVVAPMAYSCKVGCRYKIVLHPAPAACCTFCLQQPLPGHAVCSTLHNPIRARFGAVMYACVLSLIQYTITNVSAASLFVLLLACHLQEAAAANSLSDIRFKLLNIALATASLGHLLVLGPRLNGGGALLPIVLGTWALSALLGSVNLLQKPKDA